MIPGTRWTRTYASTEALIRGAKIRIITIGPSRGLSEIKLKRTDTTLDLSPAVGVSKINRGDGWFGKGKIQVGGSLQKAKRAKEEKKKM